ncbi:APC family permease [Yoonia sediminilitoris]|uniref:Amino acid/polyamine/organocation transporter (APC superfamily) n=1 Tax=Yoonia sediminilitoris TaxID=1286148 RepID=A0A2T6K658_9RHOB|nr:amino acid permease [Yoonia sediminilitoris]PUB10150.1 amino acid/polyamine/organocation transporter (APC superfamily) [Yoonia sediminilitoris]RCW89672.1 amino acid/polyamine/organocation transporter (APC superfamily) [Yoonia sediminilitoris]
MTNTKITKADAGTDKAIGLRRTLTLPLLTLYGLGVTVGAGIYVLIGTTVAQAGPFAWVAFLLAAFVVGFTAFSYAELATRFPVSAGEAAYVAAGFKQPWLATVVGLLVVVSGMVSASAVAVGASGYLGDMTGLPSAPLIVGIVATMGLLAWWGITQSVTVAAVVTVIEILGLCLVIAWGVGFSAQGGTPASELLPPLQGSHWGGIISASLLAFFAFIGFEDMVNVAEEVENPRRTIPLAIVYTLIVATLLYIATCVAVLLAVPLEKLAGSAAPLTLVFANAPEAIKLGFAAIAVVATINGVLIQMIMASRVLYGMADRGGLPAIFARLSPRTRTPSVATAFVTASILGLGLFLPIEQLAAWTSQIVLCVFVCVNLSLVAIKHRSPGAGDHFHVPVAVPICGVGASIALLVIPLT